jgi:hypothetical protein
VRRIRPTFRFAELTGLARLAFGLPRFLRHRLSYQDAERLVRDGVARREERFLKKLDEVVFARRQSPYLALKLRGQGLAVIR